MQTGGQAACSRQEVGGRRQEAGGRRQEAAGRGLGAGRKTHSEPNMKVDSGRGTEMGTHGTDEESRVKRH